MFLRAPSRGSGLLLPLPLVDLHVAPPLVAAGKLPATLFTGERFFTCVCADVRGQVIAAAKVPHADATLEWFVACVDPQVTTQLVGAGEPTVAALGRTRVWALMHRCLARSIRVLPGSEDRPQGQVLVGWECSCHRGLRGPQSVIPNSVERCERWSHAQRVQRMWEGLVSLAVLRVIPSVLGHNGQQCSALYGRFGCRVVGRWWVKGDSTGGCAQEAPCWLLMVHVPATGVGRDRWRRRRAIHVIDVMTVCHGPARCFCFSFSLSWSANPNKSCC